MIEHLYNVLVLLLLLHNCCWGCASHTKMIFEQQLRICPTFGKYMQWWYKCLNLWGSLEAWTDGNNISTQNCLTDLFPCSLPRVIHPFIKLLQMTISACQPCFVTDKAGSTMARLLSGVRVKAPCESVTKALTFWAAYNEELLKSRHLLLKRKAEERWQ